MKTLMVTPYPPARDGLAAYALQLSVHLRSSGEVVDVVSPHPSGARYHADFLSWRGRLKLLRLARRYDRVIVQYHPFFFFGASGRLGYVSDIFAMGWLFGMSKRVEVYVHEVDYSAGSRRLAPLWRFVWRRPSLVLIHTAKERSDLIDTFRLAPSRVQLVDHGRAFVSRADMSQLEARAAIGLEAGAYIFVCIGFIQEHKGFDRAVRAMASLDAGTRVQLHLVGSLRVPTPEHRRYLDHLRRLVDATEGAYLHEAFVSDAGFDRWIVAADTIVLPYRMIWSSGVLERAALLNRPAIVTDVGGLSHQARGDTLVVKDEAQLVQAMARLAGLDSRGEEEDVPSTYDSAIGWISDVGQRLWYWADGMAETVVPTNATFERSRTIDLLPFPLEPNAAGAKRLLLKAVTRLTRWQLMPVVSYVNRLRDVIVFQGFSGGVNQPPAPSAPDNEGQAVAPARTVAPPSE